MAQHFSKKTFDYFAAAKKNKHKRDWLEKNRPVFEEHVREPYTSLLAKIKRNFGDDLPRIDISPKKISRPMRVNVDKDSGYVRTNSTLFLSEKPTSRFESNPGFYFSIGAEADDNILGVGLYMPSGRQMSLLRENLVNDFDEIHGILSSRQLKNIWGGLSGELYKRFPKGYDEDSEAARYLRQKQFFMSEHPSRKTLTSKSFEASALKHVETALPFFKWLRQTVGTSNWRKKARD